MVHVRLAAPRPGRAELPEVGPRPAPVPVSAAAFPSGPVPAPAPGPDPPLPLRPAVPVLLPARAPAAPVPEPVSVPAPVPEARPVPVAPPAAEARAAIPAPDSPTGADAALVERAAPAAGLWVVYAAADGFDLARVACEPVEEGLCAVRGVLGGGALRMGGREARWRLLRVRDPR